PAPAIGLAGPWPGFSQLRSKLFALRQPSPPAKAVERGCAGALLSIRIACAGLQLPFSAKSTAQDRTSCGPSLNAVVATAWVAEAAGAHGCTCIPRHWPPVAH